MDIALDKTLLIKCVCVVMSFHRDNNDLGGFLFSMTTKLILYELLNDFLCYCMLFEAIGTFCFILGYVV